MTTLVIVAALVVGGTAAAWPYLLSLSRRQAGLSASDRAAWVNRLFALTESSDDASVTNAAKSLISALVAGNDPKKVK